MNLTNFNTSSVTSMSNMFYDCNLLEYLFLTNFNLINLEDPGDMFNNIINLKYIDISNIINSEKITNVFSSMDSKEDLIIFQKEEIVKDVNNASCVFIDEKMMCHSDNYIIVKYGEVTEYPNGFANDKRNDIIFIIYNNTLFKKNEALKIEKNGTIEIYFGKPVESLLAFFGYNEARNSGDVNVKNIVLVDLSHLNSTMINNVGSMFDGCISVEEINFTNFDTSSVTYMNSMFSGCSNLKSLDLSGFITLNVDDMSYIFADCKSLEFLDISNFYINFDTNVYNMFSGINNLSFINLFSVQNGEFLKNNSKIETLNDDVKVCQKEDIITKDNTTNVCNNFIRVCYRKYVIYENGFKYNEEEINKYRDNISDVFIENSAISLSQNPLKINSSCIIIKFSSPVESLAHFFDSEYDKNAENITSIDLSNFDSSLITEINSLFKGCKSLENINFTNSNSSLVTNMSEVFSGCIELKVLNLSFLDTSSLNDIHNMFYECSNLKIIDLSGLKFDKIITSHNMFKDNDNIKYIDLLEVKNSFLNITNSNLNRKDDLTICQNEDIITNIKAMYCCDYNIELYKCENIPTTFLDSSTIIFITNDFQSQSQFIKSTEILINKETTQKKEENTINIPTTIPKVNTPTTIPKINIPTTILKTIIQTNIPKTSPTNIPKPIPSTIPKTNIPLTIPKTIVSTTIPSFVGTSSLITNENIVQTSINENIETTILETGKVSLILLGFSHLTLLEKLISFFIYFVRIKNVLRSQKMKLTLNLSYNTTESRALKEVEGICTLQESSFESKYQYLCEVEVNTANISKIEIIPDFYFINQDNVEIVGMTPISRMFMNNLLSLDSYYDILSSCYVYIMDNSSYNIYDKGLFNITGIIDDPQPRFDNKNIVVMINLNSEDKLQTGVNCLVNKVSESNYTSLDCNSKETIEGYLQSAISFIDYEDILLIYFQETNQSIIEMIEQKYSRASLRLNKSNGLSGGAIAAIVIIPIAVIAAIISMAYYLNRKNKEQIANPGEESSIKQLSI